MRSIKENHKTAIYIETYRNLCISELQCYKYGGIIKLQVSNETGIMCIGFVIHKYYFVIIRKSISSNYVSSTVKYLKFHAESAFKPNHKL